MKKQTITATFTRKELQEINIALMTRNNILAEARGEKRADEELKELIPLIDKILALLEH